MTQTQKNTKPQTDVSPLFVWYMKFWLSTLSTKQENQEDGSEVWSLINVLHCNFRRRCLCLVLLVARLPWCQLFEQKFTIFIKLQFRKQSHALWRVASGWRVSSAHCWFQGKSWQISPEAVRRAFLHYTRGGGGPGSWLLADPHTPTGLAQARVSKRKKKPHKKVQNSALFSTKINYATKRRHDWWGNSVVR